MREAPAAASPAQLGAPAVPAPAARAAPVPPGSLLDLDDAPGEPAPSPAAAPGTAPRAAGVTSPAARTADVAPPPRLPHMPGTGRLLLTPTAPVVALSRLTSGIGALRVEAAVTSGGGDLVLSCAYAFTTGETSFMNPDDVQQATSAGARVPLLVAGRDRFPRFVVDLRQVRRLARALIVLHSRSGAPVRWAGAVVISTQSGTRIDVPLESAPDAATVAAVSIYQVDGEIVLRAEVEPAVSPREACRSFGYETVAWLDDAHALV